MYKYQSDCLAHARVPSTSFRADRKKTTSGTLSGDGSPGLRCTSFAGPLVLAPQGHSQTYQVPTRDAKPFMACRTQIVKGTRSKQAATVRANQVVQDHVCQAACSRYRENMTRTTHATKHTVSSQTRAAEQMKDSRQNGASDDRTILTELTTVAYRSLQNDCQSLRVNVPHQL